MHDSSSNVSCSFHRPRCAQSDELRLQVRNPTVALRDDCGHLGGFKSLGNVLRAIGVPRTNLEYDDLRRARLVALGHQPLGQVRVTFDDPRVAPELHALSMRIVDQEQMRLRILGEVAKRDVLPVADEVDETDGLIYSKNPTHSRWRSFVETQHPTQSSSTVDALGL